MTITIQAITKDAAKNRARCTNPMGLTDLFTNDMLAPEPASKNQPYYFHLQPLSWKSPQNWIYLLIRHLGPYFPLRARQITEGIKNLIPVRNQVLHGAVTSFTPSTPDQRTKP